jgi:hypothetical protein
MRKEITIYVINEEKEERSCREISKTCHANPLS